MSDSPQTSDPQTWETLNALSDAEVLARLVAGEASALAVLFDRYHRLVFSVAVRMLHDEGEAEDVVQTVFLNIFQSAANFDPRRGTLKVWLLQYAYHRSINRRRMLAAQGIYRWEELEDSFPVDRVPEPELVRYCEQLLKRLKPRQREVLELTYFEGRTTAEIAAEQNRPVAHVRHDLYRSLARLRSAVAKSENHDVSGEAEVRKRRRAIADTPAL
jgi:RNA polymerase sigma-70 factor (ECF subfamily)